MDGESEAEYFFMKINITSMNKKITFQKKETIELSGGDKQVEWTDVAELWANVKLQSAKESIDEMNRTVNGFSKKIVCRFIKDVDVSMRIKSGDDVYNIINIENVDGKNNYLSIMVEDFKD